MWVYVYFWERNFVLWGWGKDTIFEMRSWALFVITFIFSPFGFGLGEMADVNELKASLICKRATWWLLSILRKIKTDTRLLATVATTLKDVHDMELQAWDLDLFFPRFFLIPAWDSSLILWAQSLRYGATHSRISYLFQDLAMETFWNDGGRDM